MFPPSLTIAAEFLGAHSPASIRRMVRKCGGQPLFKRIAVLAVKDRRPLMCVAMYGSFALRGLPLHPGLRVSVS